jgi:hypothetical protein
MASTSINANMGMVGPSFCHNFYRKCVHWRSRQWQLVAVKTKAFSYVRVSGKCQIDGDGVQKLRASRLRIRRAGGRCEGRKAYGSTPEDQAVAEKMKVWRKEGKAFAET